MGCTREAAPSPFLNSQTLIPLILIPFPIPYHKRLPTNTYISSNTKQNLKHQHSHDCAIQAIRHYREFFHPISLTTSDELPRTSVVHPSRSPFVLRAIARTDLSGSPMHTHLISRSTGYNLTSQPHPLPNKVPNSQFSISQSQSRTNNNVHADAVKRPRFHHLVTK